MNHTPPVPANADHCIRFTGDAVLKLNSKRKIPAKFVLKSVDGIFPSTAELTVDPDVADYAFQNGPWINLEIFGVKMKTQIAVQIKHTPVLLIFAAPLLRALARAMEEPHRPYGP